MGYLDDLWNTKYFDLYSFKPEEWTGLYSQSDYGQEGMPQDAKVTQYVPSSYYSDLLAPGNTILGGWNSPSKEYESGLIYKDGSPIARSITPSEYQTLSDMYRLGLLKQPTTTTAATVPTETPIDYGVGTAEGGTDLEIPEGLYPYALKGAYQGVSPQNQGLMQLPFAEALAGLQEYLRPGGAEKLFGETRQGLLSGFRPTYEGKITESLAPLAEKGLLGGTTQENILKGVTAELSKSYDVEALNRTEERVKNFLTSIGGLGELLKYSSEYAEEANPLAPYELWSKLASAWLGNT